jgi:hypothetical protein
MLALKCIVEEVAQTNKLSDVPYIWYRKTISSSLSSRLSSVIPFSSSFGGVDMAKAICKVVLLGAE